MNDEIDHLIQTELPKSKPGTFTQRYSYMDLRAVAKAARKGFAAEASEAWLDSANHLVFHEWLLEQARGEEQA